MVFKWISFGAGRYNAVNDTKERLTINKYNAGREF